MKPFVCALVSFVLLWCRPFPGPAAQAQSLQVHPQALDLGPVKLGSHATGEILLENSGSDELEVLVGVQGDYFAASPETLSLSGHASESIAVRFTARAAGEFQGELSVQVKTFFKKKPFTLPLRALATRASIRIAPDQSLSMGSLQAGEKARKTIVLANPGPVVLEIDSLSLATRETPFHLPSAGPIELAPGQKTILEVDFKPVQGGVYRNQLFIHSSDLDPPRLELELTGEAQVPRAKFSPLPEVGLDFDHLEVGQSRTLRVTVLNQGQADLLIQAVETSGGAFASTWDSSAATPIPPDQRREIAVRFRPRYEGRASGKLILSTSDPQFTRVEIPLQGMAQLSPPVIEVLNQDDIGFGNVALGKYERDHLVVWNRGGTPYTVRLDIEGEAQGEFELEFPSALLQPGEFKKIELKFSPRETGERRANLLVGTESGRRQIGMYGIGKFLDITPTTLDFDRVVVGKASSRQVELLNIGNADFTITHIRSSNPKNFSIKSQVSPANKFILPADALRSLPVSLAFSPSARGAATGILQLEGYWDEAFETREVLLTGTGIAADLELHPSGSFEFDYVVLGEREAKSLVATNTGDTDLRVEAHPETPEAFVKPSSFSLKPGASTTLQLYFAPAALGKRAGRIRLISNDVKEKALPLQIKGKGALGSIDLTQVISVLVSRKNQLDTLKVGWNNTPVVLQDQTKIDLVFHLEDSLGRALIGRKFEIAWTQLDDNYEEQGSARQTKVQLHDSGEDHVLAEEFNLRLEEKSNKRVRLTITTSNHPGAPPQKISQLFEAGGWKWEFEAKPLVSFLSIRPGRDYKDKNGKVVKGKTERLIGLPGIAFFGWHNAENPSVSGVHLTATGNVLEALSTENSIAISVGIAISMYKDRFMFGLGWDVYDHRLKAKRKGTQDYIMTFKYWGLF